MKRLLSAATIAVAFALAAVATAQAQDARRGEHVFRKCRLCHVTDPNAKDLVAPPLHNVIGRKAATVPGFDYSEIMLMAREKGLTWTPEALFYFLDRPEEFMPGTYMAFAGLEEAERRDVIAYLQKITREFKQTPSANSRQPSAQTPAPGGPAFRRP